VSLVEIDKQNFNVSLTRGMLGTPLSIQEFEKGFDVSEIQFIVSDKVSIALISDSCSDQFLLREVFGN
jgi:hypothetical protein